MAPTKGPSSSTDGFFQVLPRIEPQYTSPALTTSGPHSVQTASDDPVLARIVRLYLPAKAQATVGAELHRLSRRVLQPAVLDHVVDAETNLPFLRPLTTFGEENREDPLVTSEGWRALKKIAVEERVVHAAYDKSVTSHNRRVEQFALHHVWSHSAALTMCPLSMTDGAATMLSRHLNDPDGDQPGRQAVIRESYRRLISKDPSESWTSGQWMTERTGGSDVRGTETLARRLSAQEIAQDAQNGISQDIIGQPLGPWRIDGFKWFSSATDSDMTVLLAQTSKGLSAFMVPIRRRAGNGRAYANEGEIPTELNGIRIQRLKTKLGTRAVPTAELEIKGGRGWLLGEEGKGVREIAALFNITRIYTSVGSATNWSRGLAICRAYSKARTARGKFLWQHPQHLFWMAGETVKYWAATQFAFFGVALQGCVEQGWNEAVDSTAASLLIPRDPAAQAALLRLLTPVMKSQVSLAAIEGVRASMECLGGVGYCENHEDHGVLNISRLFRDTVVQVIWEGTVSVMAEDIGRVLKDKRVGGGNVIPTVYAQWVNSVLSQVSWELGDECAAVQERLQALIDLVTSIDHAELEYRGRDILRHLEVVTAATLLLFDAIIDGDEIATHIARRYVRSTALPNSDYNKKEMPDWKTELEVDRRIFLGDGFRPVNSKGKL